MEHMHMVVGTATVTWLYLQTGSWQLWYLVIRAYWQLAQ
jgi:hypothetical protein